VKADAVERAVSIEEIEIAVANLPIFVRNDNVYTL
jgi:hypothetical protein